MLYICDNANDQQSQRNRLFLRWFRGAEQSKQFYIKTAVVVDEGMENFIAIVVPFLSRTDVIIVSEYTLLCKGNHFFHFPTKILKKSFQPSLNHIFLLETPVNKGVFFSEGLLKKPSLTYTKLPIFRNNFTSC